jgi:ATP-dependent Lon protease
LSWRIYINLPVNKKDGQEKLHEYLSNSAQFLETVSYGQFKAKSTILLELGRYLENPGEGDLILGVKGPPGSGQTTLINMVFLNFQIDHFSVLISVERNMLILYSAVEKFLKDQILAILQNF